MSRALKPCPKGGCSQGITTYFYLIFGYKDCFLLFSPVSRDAKKASVHDLCSGCDTLFEKVISLTFFRRKLKLKLYPFISYVSSRIT